ncbi:hypothetical protein BDV10DRAFT_160377 [Aspergillus recurvatus]
MLSKIKYAVCVAVLTRGAGLFITHGPGNNGSPHFRGLEEKNHTPMRYFCHWTCFYKARSCRHPGNPIIVRNMRNQHGWGVNMGENGVAGRATAGKEEGRVGIRCNA